MEPTMRTLFSLAIVMACAASTSVPALAQQSMSAHQMPAMSHVGGAGHGSGDMHHHFGHHRHRGTTLVPLGFWDWAPQPDVVVMQPQGAPADAVPPPPQAPPTQTADLPPCRETTADGVVVLRGMACTRGER